MRGNSTICLLWVSVTCRRSSKQRETRDNSSCPRGFTDIDPLNLDEAEFGNCIKWVKHNRV